MSWQDATGPHNTDWEAVHAVIGNMPDHERGWYRGVFDGLAYAQAQVLGGTLRKLTVDAPEGYAYSPSGTAKSAPSFYEEAPPPADLVEVQFDPLKFLCVAAEADNEAAIIYIAFEFKQSAITPYLRVVVASTENRHGLPKTWPKTKDGSEIWRPFAHAEKLREKLGLG